MQHPIQIVYSPEFIFPKATALFCKQWESLLWAEIRIFHLELMNMGIFWELSRKKKKKSCQRFSKQLHNPCFIWGVDPAVQFVFAMASSARLVAMATIIPEQPAPLVVSYNTLCPVGVL